MYEYFLCHNKIDGGAFCRLLNMRLKKTQRGPRQRGQIFDSDNLESLNLLLVNIGAETGTIVVSCARRIFYRPWCLGEMTTARCTRSTVPSFAFHDLRGQVLTSLYTTRTSVSNVACAIHIHNPTHCVIIIIILISSSIIITISRCSRPHRSPRRGGARR